MASLLAEPLMSRIYVVNNGEEVIDAADARVVVISPESNLGVGGGYARGITEASGLGSSWIWLLDDDAWVEAGSLAKLLAIARRWRVAPAALVPAVCDESGALALPPAVRTGGPLLRFRRVRAGEIQVREVTIAAWAGLLVSAEAVREAGLPSTSMFIDGDDTEFTYRLSQVGPILFAPEAVVRHPRPAGGGMVLPQWRMYHDVRNTVAFMLLHQRPWLRPVELARILAWQLRLLARSPKRERSKRLRLLAYAVRQGLNATRLPKQ